MKKVLFIYKYLPQYRIEFFKELKKELIKYSIELKLIYGKSTNDYRLRGDEVNIEWGTFIPNRTIIKIGKDELIWQPCLRHIKDADLVIIQPELKLLLTYYLVAFRSLMNYKLAFWGHGRNMQGKENSLRNKFNNLFINRCDWYFAYTKGVREFLINHHYSKRKITVVQNAIDTFDLRKNYNKINSLYVNKIKDELGIFGNNTAIYCGAMYKEKRLDFIVNAGQNIKNKIPDFNLLLIGSGIDAYKAKKAAEDNKWIHYLGPKFGQERIVYFKISTLQLMPGAIGLGILDSFALETPIITTKDSFHGPEIDYLDNWANGVITRDNLDIYSDTVVDILKTNKYLKLIEGCKESSELYSIQKMVKNFKHGILSCVGFEYDKNQPIKNIEILN